MEPIEIRTCPLRALTYAERRCLRALTNPGPDSHMRRLLDENTAHAQCFLALAGPEILGWSVARWFAPLSECPRNAHLSVFVAPQWRRRGLGRDLIEAAVQFVTAHRLTPWVYAEGSAQLGFYRACPSVRHISRLPFALR